MNEAIMLLIVALAILLCWTVSNRERERQFSAEREAWAKERKDLMDRIQAPTFTEYTNKVVREKNAEQPEEPPVEHEFIS